MYSIAGGRAWHAHLIPPIAFSILTSPITVSPWLLTLFNNSLFAGISSLRVALRSNSEAAEYGLAEPIHDARSVFSYIILQ